MSKSYNILENERTFIGYQSSQALTTGSYHVIISKKPTMTLNYFLIRGITKSGEVKFVSAVKYNLDKLKQQRKQLKEQFENLTFLIYDKNGYIITN